MRNIKWYLLYPLIDINHHSSSTQLHQHTKPFLGFVSESFVWVGHQKRQFAWPLQEKCVNFFPQRNANVFCIHFENRTGSPRLYGHQKCAQPTELLYKPLVSLKARYQNAIRVVSLINNVIVHLQRELSWDPSW